MTHKVEVDILYINWPICRPDLSVPARCVIESDFRVMSPCYRGWQLTALVNCNGLLPGTRPDALQQKANLWKQKISAIATVLGAASVIMSSNATETSNPCTHPSSQAKDGLKDFSTNILPDFTTSWAWRNMSSVGYYQYFKWGVDCMTQETWKLKSNWQFFCIFVGLVHLQGFSWRGFNAPQILSQGKTRHIFFYQLMLKIYCKDVFTTFLKCLYPDQFTLNM